MTGPVTAHGRPTGLVYPVLQSAGVLGLGVEFEDGESVGFKIAERHVSFFQEPADQPWGMRTAYFKDPDGHVWEIAQPIERSDP